MTCWTWHVGQKDLIYISRLLGQSLYETSAVRAHDHVIVSHLPPVNLGLVVLPGFVHRGVAVAWTTVVATVVAAYNDVISALVV
jgi:uncharacterized membrane protein